MVLELGGGFGVVHPFIKVWSYVPETYIIDTATLKKNKKTLKIII